MIRSLQTVGWSLLAPEPVPFEPGVVCLVGQNGSGKSSTLNAIQAVCGARRFGRDRSVSHYRFAGRAGAPAARHAYVFAVCDNRRHDGTMRLPAYGDTFTLVCQVGASRRSFLVLDGTHLIPTDDRMEQALREIHEKHPRSSWLTPDEYGQRILEPLGVGPAVRRMLELPQGEVQRALDREPRELVGLLLELTGGRDAGERFQAASAQVESARAAHAEAGRRIDRRRAEIAEAKLKIADAVHAQARRRELALLAGEAERLLAENPAQPAKRKKAVRASRLAFDRTALRQAGIELVVRDGLLCVDPSQRDRAEELLAAGEALLVAGDGLEFLTQRGLIVAGPPLTDEPTAEAAPEPEPALTEQQRAQLERLLGELEIHDIRSIAPDEEAERWDAAALAGALRALMRDGVPLPPDPRAEERIQTAEALLAADSGELERKREALDEATGQLAAAREAYEQAVVRALTAAADRFQAICAEAGLAGRMEVHARAGEPHVEIWAAETPQEELRPLHGAQASLSGGWRATVVVLAVLACMDASTSVPVLLLDEVGSSLDEPRLVALGRAFASLAKTRGLQTIMTLPTREQSEMIGQFASAQLGFFRPAPDEPVAPPPHVVSAGSRRELAA